MVLSGSGGVGGGRRGGRFHVNPEDFLVRRPPSRAVFLTPAAWRARGRGREDVDASCRRHRRGPPPDEAAPVAPAGRRKSGPTAEAAGSYLLARRQHQFDRLLT